MDQKECKSRFNRICVFCGSSTGKRNCYQDAAIELGKELVCRKVNLVYGGGSIGLMGLVSQEVSRGGGHVLGIIPKTLMSKELTGETVGEVRTVASMHQRKAEMARNSDAFIALPGGYGTLEELLEVITWAQLGIHDKPVGLLNVDGYYDSLLSFIDKAVDDGFISPSQRSIIVSAPTAKELVQMLEEGGRDFWCSAWNLMISSRTGVLLPSGGTATRTIAVRENGCSKKATIVASSCLRAWRRAGKKYPESELMLIRGERERERGLKILDFPPVRRLLDS